METEKSEKSWGSWREHVLAESKRNNDNCLMLATSLAQLHIEVAKLQIKAGVWGLLGGLIPVLITLALLHFK